MPSCLNLDAHGLCIFSRRPDLIHFSVGTEMLNPLDSNDEAKAATFFFVGCRGKTFFILRRIDASISAASTSTTAASGKGAGASSAPALASLATSAVDTWPLRALSGRSRGRELREAPRSLRRAGRATADCSPRGYDERHSEHCHHQPARHRGLRAAAGGKAPIYVAQGQERSS